MVIKNFSFSILTFKESIKYQQHFFLVAWQNSLHRHDDSVQVLRHFPTETVVRSHPCDAGKWLWYSVNMKQVSHIEVMNSDCCFLLWGVKMCLRLRRNSSFSFRTNTHVRCPEPILRHGSTGLPSSAASPLWAGRLGWARRRAWSRSRARRRRSEPRSPPPRTPPGSTGGLDGRRPARELRRSGDTNTRLLL